MSRLAILLATAVAALALVASASAATPRLDGAVGPGFTITLKMKGAKVTKLKAGKYQIVVKDLSNIHNFHLTGPGVNKDTGVAKTGTTTWTVTLRKGTYIFVCDPHASIMKGKLTVS